MEKIYSVTQINSYVKNLFSNDFLLKNLVVKGEVSNCKYHTSGHIYFTLKDEKSAISCVMFAGKRAGLSFRMKDGDLVEVTGSVEIYDRDGKYQLYARIIKQSGIGDLHIRFEELKKELYEMGMFAPEYKKPIPKYSKKIGIVTASTGAAIRDIENIATRRNPYVQLILYPAIVQGDGAAISIVNGIKYFNSTDVDVIIIGRGGGSIEDLWCFNEEIVARAIFESEKPIVSAVGHEIDTTISDYVADLRAPTPSAAAELTVYDYNEFMESINIYHRQLSDKFKHRISDYRLMILNYKNALMINSPDNRINEIRYHIANLDNKLNNSIETLITENKTRILRLSDKIDGLSPAKRLKAGFAYVEDRNKNKISLARDAKLNETIRMYFSDGKLDAKIEEIHMYDEG